MKLLVKRSIADVRETSYDAEMMAGSIGLTLATKQSYETIHVLADNDVKVRTQLDLEVQR